MAYFGIKKNKISKILINFDFSGTKIWFLNFLDFVTFPKPLPRLPKKKNIFQFQTKQKNSIPNTDFFLSAQNIVQN